MCVRAFSPSPSPASSLSLSFHEIAENCAFDTIKLKCVRHYSAAAPPLAPTPPAIHN